MYSQYCIVYKIYDKRGLNVANVIPIDINVGVSSS